MENIYLLLIVCLFLWYFIYLRKVSEFALRHITAYCEKDGLQFISLSRRSNRLTFSKALGPHWISIFDFEFSGDGESSYQGQATLKGYKLENTHVPMYKI
ncbi:MULTISPECIES: DUF3301 domain-containing protein [unclassified Colwellia]|uniref:DUF3301 domain-containing protein n=1 Tax=unclassified Colwellia TaxID=196834 RepID=UPI0015F3D2B6|nr:MULTISPECIES: DUF3301 domain-containing protein [unclassified Colwellia]MBA6356030.1 DUF3301 domain-containing protein [Colwellia sp. BRX8-3]MBA6358597.1 DUF3301 domain-containing protein [Colwellia sp. BRX8-6]MBA6366752.1 DUF3301 domain-containing protein [Colwellia sp. BRX8-5]MBA6376609.1 DUF3301 domain-containing protein [Colwellia sp. BRX8-2]